MMLEHLLKKATCLLMLSTTGLFAQRNDAHFSLNENWHYQPSVALVSKDANDLGQSISSEGYTTKLPNTVLNALLESGVIEDPFYRTNESRLQWLEKKDWIFEKTFDASTEMLTAKHTDLILRGLDTYAEVYLNDALLFNADNMFRTWKADVRTYLKPKGNLLKMAGILDSGVFPGMQGGPLEHVIAAKAIAFGESLQPEFKEYGHQVIKNAQAMAKAFVAKGYNIISGGTDNHLMLIDLRNKNVTGKQAQETLEAADITLNKNAIPFDTQSPMITSGIRVGTPAVTTRGFDEADCVQVVEWIDAVLSDIENTATVARVQSEVNEFMLRFPLYEQAAVFQ